MTATTSRGLPGNSRTRAGRGYGVFRRSLPLLSSHLREDKIEASVQDGVPEITVPKATEAQALRALARRWTEISMISTDGTPRHSPAAPHNGCTIVRLSGALDLAAAPALREHLIDVLHHGTDLLVLDLSLVPSCDAAGLAVLIGTQRRARLLGIAMRLAAPSVPVGRVLRSTGLYSSFTIYPDLSGALAPERHEPAMSAPGPALPAAGQSRPLVPGARSA